jgi:putative transposase
MHGRKNFRRKTNRLKDFEYINPFIYFVTICSYEKNKTFVNSDIVSEKLKHLEKSADKHNLKVLAYCFMPDHVHLLIGSNDTEGNLINFIKEFKQKTGYEFKKKHEVNLWQKSFYDHILRKEESVIDLVRYIFNNPVRKGLVTEFKKYSFLGSMVVDIDDIY